MWRSVCHIPELCGILFSVKRDNISLDFIVSHRVVRYFQFAFFFTGMNFRVKYI